MFYVFLGMVIGVCGMMPALWWVSRRTERRVRHLEQRTRVAERLAELGTLTGGLAHEIKNPLSTVGLNLQLLRESVESLEISEQEANAIIRRIDAVTQESERLRGILEDFLSFAGRVRLDPKPTRINEVVEQMVDFYLPQATSSGIRLRTQLDADAGQVQLDSTLFKQAVLNLLINATQAMVESRYGGSSHGGSEDLIIRTQKTTDGVAVHVIDTGPGIEAANLQKIFHPYFTTKKGGTGLGLATTRRVINEHGGHVSVHSEPGRGTDFTIFLPRGEKPTSRVSK